MHAVTSTEIASGKNNITKTIRSICTQSLRPRSCTLLLCEDLSPLHIHPIRTPATLHQYTDIVHPGGPLLADVNIQHSPCSAGSLVLLLLHPQLRLHLYGPQCEIRQSNPNSVHPLLSRPTMRIFIGVSVVSTVAVVVFSILSAIDRLECK